MSLSRKERQQAQREERAAISSPDSSPQPQIPLPKKKKVWKYAVFALGIVVLLILAAGAYRAFTPGYYDDFAKCLKEKGAVMYGAMGWCKYTQGQKAMFGKSFKYVNYHEFGDYPEEQYGKIAKTPTWIINDKVYQNTQSLSDLSKETGCPLP